MISGKTETYISEPLHLAGGFENEPLSVPDTPTLWEKTGKVAIAFDPNQYRADTPFNLALAPGPQILATFQWSALFVDEIYDIDVTYITKIISDAVCWPTWRARTLWYAGAVAKYECPPKILEPVLTSQVFGAQSFLQNEDGTFGPNLTTANNMIQKVGDQYIFNGGPGGARINRWFPTWWQIEVGYAEVNDGILETEDRWQWPGFQAPIVTDELFWRGVPGNYPGHPGGPGC